MTAISFASPSYRAAGNDLTIAISPLGIVELSDEEFEVHGPRLNRYAQNWAFYMGHHWGYLREMGEPQVTFNYVKTFSDFINNFTFGRGVEFRSPYETAHIIPSLLKKVWTQDNNKEQTLWQMGNQGGVGGDVFIKVAYEPGAPQYGLESKVRILVLNASFCFPEWHPHDRDRLLRFKMKYRFWGTTAEGTRQVFTYTEIITDDIIEEYINDELIDQRPNPLGVIPIVHIANTPMSTSPWGVADIQDIVPLNRLYNEMFTDVVDIINYHAAPVTVITGAKAQGMEKGPKKVWSGLPEKAQVFNLENGVNLSGPLEALENLKRSMHEITGVPEGALGQMQPISNTSGVALSIMYTPMMQRYNLKKLQYTVGIEKVNEYVLKTLAIFEPELFIYDPETEGIKQEDQPDALDIADPLTFVSEVHWPPPLPVDALITLQEVQMEMALNLESRKGALQKLGIEFPDEKLNEIRKEQIDDIKDAGALALLKAQIDSVIFTATGMPPADGAPPPVSQPGVAGGEGSPDQDPVGPQPGAPAPVTAPNTMDVFTQSPDQAQQLLTELVTKAYGTRVPLRRQPDND